MRIESKRGLGTLRTEQRSPDQAKREFELTLLAKGGVQFDMQVGESTQHVVALPEVIRPIPTTGEVETKREAILRGGGFIFQGAAVFMDQLTTGQWRIRDVDNSKSETVVRPGMLFAEDFSDAPAGLAEAAGKFVQARHLGGDTTNEDLPVTNWRNEKGAARGPDGKFRPIDPDAVRDESGR